MNPALARQAIFDFILGLRAKLPHIEAAHPIGSSLIPGCTPKDFDLQVLLGYPYTYNDFEQALKAHYPDMRPSALNESGKSVRSYRIGGFNIVVMDDPAQYGRGLLAQDLCIAMELTNKVDRILVFDVVRECMHPAEARQKWRNNIDMGVE